MLHDSLSYLLQQYTMSISLQKHCNVNGKWQLPHPPTTKIQLCWHFILSGNLYLDTPSQPTQVLTENSIVFLPGFTSHRLSHIPQEKSQAGHDDKADTKNEILCGTIDLPSHAQVFFGNLPPFFVLSKGTDPDKQSAYCRLLTSVSHVLHTEMMEKRLGETEVIEQLIKTLFILGMRAWIEKKSNDLQINQMSNQATKSQDIYDADDKKGSTTNDIGNIMLALLSPKLNQTIIAMFESPSETWTVENLASLAHMSRATFARHFKETTGMSPMQMLTHIRMNKASALLNQPTTKINQLCYDVGYASESAFHKAFVRHFGMTPGTYQQQAIALSNV